MSVFRFITDLPELIGPVFLWEAAILWLLLANTINIVLFPWFKKNQSRLLKFEKSFSMLLGNLALTTGFIGTLIGLITGLSALKPGDPAAISVVFAAISNSIWSTVGGSVISALALISYFVAERKESKYQLATDRISIPFKSEEVVSLED